MHVSSLGNERIDYSKVTQTGRVMQRRITKIVVGIHILAHGNEGIEDGKVALAGRVMQWRYT
jgi:hypothetical protein